MNLSVEYGMLHAETQLLFIFLGVKMMQSDCLRENGSRSCMYVIYIWMNTILCCTSTFLNWMASRYHEREVLGYAAVSVGWICSTIMFVGFIYYLHLARSWEMHDG
jgi:hypothetical protein